MRTLAIVALVLAGCVVGDDPSDDDLDDAPPDDAEVTAFATRFAAADTFNKPNVSHSDDGSGVVVKGLHGAQTLTVYDSFHQPIAHVALAAGPRDGNVRIATLEKIEVGGATMFRLWPKSSQNNGWVELADVDTGSTPVTEEVAARAGNGRACGSENVGALENPDGHPTRLVVHPVPVIDTGDKDTVWRINASTGDWYTFHPDWDKPAGVDRVFLMWSWTRTKPNGQIDNFNHGGVARTEMPDGGIFIPCRVQPIRTILREASAAKGSKPAPGSRTLAAYAAYGKYETPAHTYYGWTIVADRLGDKCQMHVACASGPGHCGRLPIPSSCTY